MSKKFLTPINLLSRDTDPEEGFNGDIYFNTILNQIKLYSSSAWNVISTSSSTGGGASVLVSDTPPESPTANSLWYESDTGDMFIYYDSYWVQVNNGGVDENYLNSTASAIGERLTIANASATYLSVTDASTIYAPLTISTNAQTGTSYTLALSDAGKIVEMNNAAANLVVIPLNSTVAFPVGTKIDIIQTGAGATSASIVSGVTLNSESGKRTINAQWQSASLIKRGTDSWMMIGAIKA